MKTLNDLLEETIRDSYNSEQQILKALPAMEARAQNPKLREAFGRHLQQTQQHVKRIDEVCQHLGFAPSGKVCQATLGLVKEAQENLETFSGSPAGDAALIHDAQKLEQYEIANYGGIISWMQDMDVNEDLIDLLEQTLQEEEEMDDLLVTIAEDEANPAAFEAWREASVKAKLL